MTIFQLRGMGLVASLLLVLLVAALVYGLLRWWHIRNSVPVPFIAPLYPFLYCAPHVLMHYRDFYNGIATAGLELGSFAFYAPFLGKPWIFLGEPDDAKYTLDHIDLFPKVRATRALLTRCLCC
jgi:hypothetical protein